MTSASLSMIRTFTHVLKRANTRSNTKIGATLLLLKMVRLAKTNTGIAGQTRRKLVRSAAKKLSKHAARKRSEPIVELRRREFCVCSKIPKWLVYMQKFKVFSKHNFKDKSVFENNKEFLFFKTLENRLFEDENLILCEHDF